MDLLSRREHTREELRRKLTHRGHPARAVEPVLEALAAEGLQSDRRFAETYVESRLARGFGPARILEELRRRGVDGADREAACDHRDPVWCRRAGDARRKRFGEALPEAFAERARQARFLHQRGFSRAHIADVLGGDPEEAPM